MNFEMETAPQVVTPVPADLLIAMHLSGITLAGSNDPVLRGWGKHLLEDWRSLELLACKYR
jgi:hypothetical protein